MKDDAALTVKGVKIDIGDGDSAGPHGGPVAMKGPDGLSYILTSTGLGGPHSQKSLLLLD